MEKEEKPPLYRFEEIIATLRAENGCPWDRKQTHRSLRPHLIEEAYELLDAIESGNPDNLKEELGDLLLQVYLHAQIAREEGRFSIDDVAESIIGKIIHRHPHVFGEDRVRDAEQVLERWEELKRKEKPERVSMLEGIPKGLPALLKAYRVQQKVSRVGFDWERIEDATAKLDEEVAELKEALASKDRDRIEEEAGDMLFSIVNLLRFMEVNPEEALRMTVEKFRGRFMHIEKRADEMGKRLEEMPIEEMESLWREAKGEK